MLNINFSENSWLKIYKVKKVSIPELLFLCDKLNYPYEITIYLRTKHTNFVSVICRTVLKLTLGIFPI